MEKFANNGATTLNGTINNSVTSLVVTSAALFPSSGNFRILIDSEIMTVTAVSGTTFTVTRGQESTSAVTHSNGATVSHVLTSGAMSQFQTDTIGLAVTEGAVGSLPVAGTPGRIYLDTDTPYWRWDNGSNWIPFGPKGPPLTEPTTGTFTTTVGPGSVSTANGGIYLSGSTSLTNSFTMKLLAVPGSTPYTLTMGFMSNMPPFSTGLATCGMMFRDSVGGKYVCFEYICTSSGQELAVENYSATNTFHATLAGGDPYHPGPMVWMRIGNDGTNRTYSISVNGINWIQYYSEVNTNYFTANQLGFFINPLLGSGGNITREPTGAMHVLHWSNP